MDGHSDGWAGEHVCRVAAGVRRCAAPRREADTPSTAIKVGDQVRVSPSVKEPKYHWGGVKHGMVGVVTVDEGESLRVTFPGAPHWHAMRDEMEKVVPDDQATAVCPQGHPLAAFVTTGACGCKAAVCRGKAQRPKGEKMHGCPPCSYELCQECFAQAGKGGAVPTSAQVGEKYMFVRTSNHNYVGRCASKEVVEVIEVAEASATSPLPVQVKWPSGFTHGAHFEDLRHLDGLPLRGDKVLETEGVKEHFYWAFCGGGVIRDAGREFLKVDRDPVPATASTGPARVVVSECGDWSYDGVYVLKENKEWRGKPLYVKDGVEDKFCYWADRDEMGQGLGQGWNLGTNNTAEGWAYFAKTTSETPPSTGWTAKDGKSGLPKITFIPGSSMLTKGVRALGALPDDAAWQVEFRDVGSHWAAGVATVEAPLSGSAYLLGDADFRESWAACFDTSGKAWARHRGHERELEGYKDVQPSLKSGLSGALSGGLAGLLGELGDLHKKLGLEERGAPFELKFWRRNGRTLVVQLPGELKERVLFTNLSSQPLYAVAATAKVGSSIRLKGQDSPVKEAQPESEDESEAWCSSPSASCGEGEREERARKKMEIAKLRKAAAKRRKEARRKAEAEAARKVLEKGFRIFVPAGKEKRNVNGEAEAQEKEEADAKGQAEAMQNANNGEGDAEETQNLNGEADAKQNLNGEAEACAAQDLNNSESKNLRKAKTNDARLGEANEPLEEQVNSKLSVTANLAMSEDCVPTPAAADASATAEAERVQAQLQALRRDLAQKARALEEAVRAPPKVEAPAPQDVLPPKFGSSKEKAEAALNVENHEGKLAQQESKKEKEEACLDLTGEDKEVLALHR